MHRKTQKLLKKRNVSSLNKRTEFPFSRNNSFAANLFKFLHLFCFYLPCLKTIFLMSLSDVRLCANISVNFSVFNLFYFFSYFSIKQIPQISRATHREIRADGTTLSYIGLVQRAVYILPKNNNAQIVAY